MNPLSSLPHHRSWARGGAFTLIELLVVISIIAVLAGLLLPVVGKVTENARKVSAKSTETQVVSAINSYQTDYGQYPVATTDTTKDTSFGTDGHNHVLFDVLRAIMPTGNGTTTTTLNSRQIVYFEGKNVKNENSPKDGFTTTTKGKSNAMPPANPVTFQVGDLVDPWGNSYLVLIDTDYNNVVSNPYANPDGSGDDPTKVDASVLHLGAICYSFGSDGVAGANNTVPTAPSYSNIGDDVVSWQ